VSNAFYGTKMLLNADIPDTVEYKTRYIIIVLFYLWGDDFHSD